MYGAQVLRQRECFNRVTFREGQTPSIIKCLKKAYDTEFRREEFIIKKIHVMQEEIIINVSIILLTVSAGFKVVNALRHTKIYCTVVTDSVGASLATGY